MYIQHFLNVLTPKYAYYIRQIAITAIYTPWEILENVWFTLLHLTPHYSTLLYSIWSTYCYAFFFMVHCSFVIDIANLSYLILSS